MKPSRIVLSRSAGFNLQATSRARNGLRAQSVARPGRWGNPFAIADVMAELGVDAAAAQAEAVRRHRAWVFGDILTDLAPPTRDMIRTALAGKNLACWCRADAPCHADTLLAIANE